MQERSFETILYSITAKVVEIIMKRNAWTENTALTRFAESKLYSYLEKEETKVWQYSAVMLAQLFEDERTGRMILPEV